MGYDLGVDLGTTYTAAATRRDERVEIVPLGTRSPVVPSVVFLRSDGQLLVGEAASRRKAVEPDRLAREFKRRMGDKTPILLGGSPHSAAALTGRLLAWVLERVAAAEGGPADHLVLTCPANWGGYKRDVLREAVDIADGEAATGTWPPGAVTVVSEPLATATHYAASARVGPGEIVAVYDLGGGTFDAAVMAGSEGGHRLLGEAIGLEHLGGIDFDDAVLAHVSAQVADHLAALDPDDPATVAALAGLRRACVEAKVALSSGTDVAVPVVLPGHRADVRLTRAEFEALIRPTLTTTITALRRALRTAGIDAGDLASVVLAGGSSRIPLVAQMLTEELGRPITSDAHPKHPVALGAARLAPRPAEATTEPVAPTAAVAPPMESVPAPEPAVTEPDPTPAPVASAWRRARRLALAGMAAVTLAALGWLAVAVTGGGNPSAARDDVAPTANERPDSGRGGSEGADGDEPLSRSGRSGDPAGDDDPTVGAGRSPAGSIPDRTGTTSRSGSGGGGSSSSTVPGSPPTTSRTPTPTTTAPPPPPGRPWSDVGVGTCVNDLSPHPPSTVTRVEEVDCASLHRFEVMGVLVKSASDYPGASSLGYDAGVYCAGLLETYYDYRGELLLGGWVGLPTEQEWYRGVRKLSCFLGPTSPPYPSPTFTGRIAP